MKNRFNLQLFADGGAGASAGAAASAGEGSGEGSGAATGVKGDSPVSQKGEDLSDVIYGVSIKQDVANPNDANPTESIKPADRKKAFENMIKKGGEWHEEFNEFSQNMINKRFKETKGLQEQLDSQKAIMQTLAAKYGVDATDTKALTKAIEQDNSMWEDAAYKEGLTVEQYRNKVALEQENARLREAEEARKEEAGAQQIYAQWLADADAVKQKYGVEFDMAAEMENPEFTQLLGSGVPFEAAYKTIHFDDMVNGAMAKTAQTVSQAMVNNIQSRSTRPAENGIQSASNKVFKSDPSKLTDADVTEICRRVARGADISF
jgi:hypothetical protein